MLAKGDAYGVFQMEGSGMRDILAKLKPNRFEDLIALVALYRPGPMDDIPTYISVKNGQEKPDYLHPSLKPILEETYGIMVYQEQVMQIAQRPVGLFAGRRRPAAPRHGQEDPVRDGCPAHQFVEGAAKNNVEDARASMIFDKVAKFAGYGFNKCHSAPYALVAYQTAYLKANYPVEFFAASMTLDMGNADKLGNFRRELERLQIPLLPPDINKSMAEFAVERTDEGKFGVRYALAAIKGVGRDAMNRLAEERATNGPFKDLFDVAERLDQRVINKRLLESLVKAGAYDSLNKNRAQTFGAVEALTRHSQATHESRGSNQNSLFGDDTAQRRPPLPKVPDWAPMERLQNEFAAIGFYLSSHPLAAYERSLERLRVTRAADLQALLTRGVAGRIKLAGTVIDRQERTSAKGNRFAFVQCSDQSGAFELTVFSELLGSKRNLLEPGQAILVSADGRLDGEQVKLTAQTVEKLDDAVANAAAGLRIVLSDPTALEPLRKALEGKRGRSRVTLVVPMPDDIGGRGDLARQLFDRGRPARHHRRPAGHRAGGGDLSRQPGLFEQSAPPPRRRASAGEVRPAWDSPLLAAPALPSDIRLGTSSWFFPGWRGLVYDGVHPQVALSKQGLAAYAQIPLLRTVSLDRTFYAPITTVQYQRYAQQVPDHFSFVVKAPALVCDAVMRDEEGRGKVPNPHFLDAAIAAREFVVPCLEGLGAKAGPLVFQVSPLPRGLVEEAATLIERLAAFFAALPQELGRHRPIYALELRNAELLTPRLMKMLAAAGVRYCVGLHDRMPEVERQEAALKALDGDTPGPLVVRWNLHRGFLYQAAKQRYEPFDRLVDEDAESRLILARMAADAFKAGQKVWITANNKAEGSAPLSLLKLAEEIASHLQSLATPLEDEAGMFRSGTDTQRKSCTRQGLASECDRR